MVEGLLVTGSYRGDLALGLAGGLVWAGWQWWGLRRWKRARRLARAALVAEREGRSLDGG